MPRFAHGRLRATRERNGWGQRQCAYLLRVDRRAYNKWELGKQAPSGWAVTRLIDLFDLAEPSDLFEDDDAPVSHEPWPRRLPTEPRGYRLPERDEPAEKAANG